MADTTEDLELFDEAQSTFPGKEDLENRLILVWVTGANGKRKGANGPYDWYETYTLVLDDPNGATDWNERIFDTEKRAERDALVPSVVKNGPQLLEKFQFSYGGMTARLRGRVLGDKPKNFVPMLGRVNSRPNKTKGWNASWSIAEPTDADKAVARQFSTRIREVSALVESAVKGTDEDAFE
jgi:hypothetical protein